jgi:hypothetical protein
VGRGRRLVHALAAASASKRATRRCRRGRPAGSHIRARPCVGGEPFLAGVAWRAGRRDRAARGSRHGSRCAHRQGTRAEGAEVFRSSRSGRTTTLDSPRCPDSWSCSLPRLVPRERAPSPASPRPSHSLAPFETDPARRFEPFVAGASGRDARNRSQHDIHPIGRASHSFGTARIDGDNSENVLANRGRPTCEPGFCGFRFDNRGLDTGSPTPGSPGTSAGFPDTNTQPCPLLSASQGRSIIWYDTRPNEAQSHGRCVACRQ